MRKLLIRILLAALFIVLVNTIAYVLKQHSPNRDNAKLAEVESLLGTIPIYPGSQEVDSSTTSKEILVSVGKYFKTDATYDALKDYYVGALTRLGWRFIWERPIKEWGIDYGGHEIYFQKDQYHIDIEYSRNADWNYALSVGWKR